MDNYSKKLSDFLSTEGVTKKDGKNVKKSKKLDKTIDSLPLDDFQKRIFAARIKQQNLSWLIKQIILGFIAVLFLCFLLTSK